MPASSGCPSCTGRTASYITNDPQVEPTSHPPDPGTELYPAEPSGTQARFMDPAAKLERQLAILTGLVKG